MPRQYTPCLLRNVQVSILKQGVLYKRTTAVGGKLVDWKRRFFVLDSQGLLYYYSQKVRWCAVCRCLVWRLADLACHPHTVLLV